jgi:hypothetical protein
VCAHPRTHADAGTPGRPHCAGEAATAHVERLLGSLAPAKVRGARPRGRDVAFGQLPHWRQTHAGLCAPCVLLSQLREAMSAAGGVDAGRLARAIRDDMGKGPFAGCERARKDGPLGELVCVWDRR